MTNDEGAGKVGEEAPRQARPSDAGSAGGAMGGETTSPAATRYWGGVAAAGRKAKATGAGGEAPTQGQRRGLRT